MTYEKFRTGFTFRDIRLMLKREADIKYQNGEYMFITRHTVLGRWRQIKLEMYNTYYGDFEDGTEENQQCEMESKTVDERQTVQELCHQVCDEIF